MKLGRFSDGEDLFSDSRERARRGCFRGAPCCYPVDNHLLELLLMIDAFQARVGVADSPRCCRITAMRGRTAKTSLAFRSPKLVCGLAGNGRRQPRVDARFARAPDSGLFRRAGRSSFRFAGAGRIFSQLKLPNVTVVSPDAGGVERARFFAKKMDAPLAIVDKRRVDVDVSEVMNLIGDVRGRSALIVDDIIDTAGTLVKTAEALDSRRCLAGIRCMYTCGPVGPGIERIAESQIKEVVATDSVPMSEAAKQMGKIRVLSVADLLARGIRSIHEETSISELFI